VKNFAVVPVAVIVFSGVAFFATSQRGLFQEATHQRVTASSLPSSTPLIESPPLSDGDFGIAGSERTD
jgi:hypothetical protein